jgi:integrase
MHPAALDLAQAPRQPQTAQTPVAGTVLGVPHAAAPGWLQIAMETSLVTLQARAEICRMRREDKRGGYLYVIRDKTAGHTDLAFLRIQVTETLEELFARAWADDIASPYLIHYRPASMRPQHLQNKPHWSAVSPGYLTRRFHALREATGLFAALAPRQRPTFHEIRSLGARTYLAQGYPRDYVRALMAHTDEHTTRIYLENPDQLTDASFRVVRAEMTLR